jgi:hypothetical protein
VGYDSPADPASQIHVYLAPGEQLLWSGRPDPEVRFAPVDLFLVPFSVMWGGFAVFWEVGVLASGAGPFFVLWGIPFVLMGLYFMIGRFAYKKRRKLKTAYGLTDRRAIVAVGASSMSDTPVNGASTSIKRSRDGSHVSITFGQRSGWGAWGPSYANTGLEFFERGTPAVGFYDVGQPETLLAALQQARAA